MATRGPGNYSATMSLQLADIGRLLVFPLLMAAAQLAFKSVAAQARGRSGISAVAAVARHPLFYAGMLGYGIATLVWIWILSRYALAVAYPFTALALVLVPLLEALFFGVRTRPTYWIGLAMIVAGAVWIVR